MTTALNRTRTTDDMRAILAFGLATLDAENIEPYNVEAVSRGRLLRIYLQAEDDEGIEQGKRLFAALGGHRHIERRHGKTWSIYSSTWSEYAQRDYGGANIDFGGRMTEVQINCSMTEDVDLPAAT